MASISPGPGAVLPALVHGGPGARGGLSFYLQRTAVQGYQPLLKKFCPSGPYLNKEIAMERMRSIEIPSWTSSVST